jgi:thiol-disulfide isomerase/thioredoxin
MLALVTLLSLASSALAAATVLTGKKREMKKRFFFFFFLFVPDVICTDATFAQTATGNWFIKFYAPWCGHCKNMAAAWDELADKTNGNGDWTIAKVDCTTNQASCSKYNVKGYPVSMSRRRRRRPQSCSQPDSSLSLSLSCRR